jgi:hypothetical protein
VPGWWGWQLLYRKGQSAGLQLTLPSRLGYVDSLRGNL